MPENPESPDQSATPAHLTYAGSSRVSTQGDAAKLELFGNTERPPVQFQGRIKDPIRFREALSALAGVVGSDYRYQPKDRTQYLAYLRLKKEVAAQTIWQAQQAYFGWMLRNDPLLFCILDPVVSVFPDQVQMEVFSKDESTYACLAFRRDAFDDVQPNQQNGTTNIDFSDALYATTQQMRAYRKTTLNIGNEQVSLKTETQPEVLEKQIRIPDSWLRGFLQVQSAATLPFDHLKLAPIDLYNALRHLRMNGDRKGQRRGIRFELVPGQQPRIVLEPWETVLESTSTPFQGRAARVVRVWGRRRLMTVKRILPFVESVDVYLLGSGLPSYWVFRAGDITLTLGMTGFTAANWSAAVGFDLLLPRSAEPQPNIAKIAAHLAQGAWAATRPELADRTGIAGPALLEALQAGCQQGQFMYDIANGKYRLRPLLHTGIDQVKIQFRGAKEKTAFDLLSRRDAVKIVSENRIAREGLELTGQVNVEDEKREYRPQMLLADEGAIRRVSCTCTAFRKSGLTDGPCVHIIALRLAYAQKVAQKSTSDSTLSFETRAFTRRVGEVEDVVQLSLERKKIKLRFGISGQAMRMQTLQFNTENDAQSAYQMRLSELDSKGYLDAVGEM